MNLNSRPASVSQIVISDPFWGRYMELIRTRVIPYQWEALNDRIPEAEPSYCMYNFRAAAGLEPGEHKGPVFQDSDLGKWLEAVGYILAWRADPELIRLADGAIDIVCAAQQEDGYLNTYYILTGLEKRWTNLMDHHELYCLGHLLEGAIAYYQATGKDKLLQAMIRYVDLVDRNFGPEPGKIRGYPGHEVLELALVRLYDITQDERHLRLAQYFIDERGQEPLYFREECARHGRQCYWTQGPHSFHYYQAGQPVREQREARGHAVRAVYLYAGMADMARKTGGRELREACEALWKSITEEQMYITGAIGSSPHGEAFSFPYDLPNDTIYGETCAAIGLVFFARRMLELSADHRYSDVMERALYNGVLSGMSLDGQRFFYVNPLEVWPEACLRDHAKAHVKAERQKWFGCSCCPPNLARLLASLGSYAYTTADTGDLWMHLYLGGRFSHRVQDRAVVLQVDTRYPWEEDIRITLSPECPCAFTCYLRIPGWCTHYQAEVNGAAIQDSPVRGYLGISREWKAGDRISLRFAMPVRVNMAHPAVRETIGKVALSRGPVVYCLEEADNGPDLHLASLGDATDFQARYEQDLLEGVTVITGEGRVLSAEWPDTGLYREAVAPVYIKRRLTWIPYYAWANRGPGEMCVWMHR